MMASTHEGAQSIASSAASAYFDAAEEPEEPPPADSSSLLGRLVEGRLTTMPGAAPPGDDAAPPPSAPAPAPAAPAPAAYAPAVAPEPFGGQSLLDVDISPPPAAAPRFASAAEPQPDPAAPDLSITVLNPCKVGDGISAYYTYEVTTRTTLPQFKFGQFNVMRRFRDFDWLASQLAQKFPGAIVPPLPDKQVAQTQTMRVSGSVSAEWLEERRAQLERFVQRVAAHPALHRAPDFHIFLEATEGDLDAYKESARLARPAPIAELLSDTKQGLLAAYAKSFSLGSALLGGDAPPPFAALQDVPCQQMANYASAVESQVAAAHRHSKRYIERHKALGESMTGFGLSLTQLAQCETEINGSLARALSQMGLTVDRLASLYGEQAAKEGAAFEEPMRDYTRMLAQCKAAIGAREAALKAYNAAAAALAAKRDRLEKGRTKEEGKGASLQAEVAAAEDAEGAAKAEYEAVAARLDAEMARFQREKLADFKHVVIDFVKLQLEYSQKVHAAWAALLPQLDAIETPPPA